MFKAIANFFKSNNETIDVDTREAMLVDIFILKDNIYQEIDFIKFLNKFNFFKDVLDFDKIKDEDFKSISVKDFYHSDLSFQEYKSGVKTLISKYNSLVGLKNLPANASIESRTLYLYIIKVEQNLRSLDKLTIIK